VRADALVSPDVLLPSLKTQSQRVAEELAQYLAESIGRGWRPSQKELEETLASLPATKAQRERLRALWREKDSEREKRFVEQLPLLTGGDPERGRAVFRGQKTACASCHRVGDDGGSVGPDLTRIGAIRSGRDLLESIVLPSSTFAQGFENFTLATHSGHIAGGVIARQDDRVLVLRDASGAETRIAKDDVESLDRQQKSLMPDGLPSTMTKEQFRDLLAYLQSLK
jgi:putative heme-binding domain-containing protein